MIRLGWNGRRSVVAGVSGIEREGVLGALEFASGGEKIDQLFRRQIGAGTGAETGVAAEVMLDVGDEGFPAKRAAGCLHQVHHGMTMDFGRHAGVQARQ